MKIKIFIDHNLSDEEVCLSDLIRVQVIKSSLVVKDFLFDEIDEEILTDKIFELVNEAVEDYKTKYIDGRVFKMLEPIEDKVQIYKLETRTYLKAV